MTWDSVMDFGCLTCILYAWSIAIMYACTFALEALFPVEFMGKTQFDIVTMIFFILNALYWIELRGTDISSQPAAPPEKVVEVPKPYAPTILIQDCDHRAMDRELAELRIAKADLEVAVVEERKRAADAEEQRKIQEERGDDFSSKLQSTKERCVAEYRTHIGRAIDLERANEQLWNARNLIRDQKKDVESSDNSCGFWMRQSSKHEKEAKLYNHQAQKYKADLMAAEKKLKKTEREWTKSETVWTQVSDSHYSEVRKLKYKVKELERAAAQEKTDIAPATEINSSVALPAELTQVAPITMFDYPPATPAKLTHITPITTCDCPPTLPPKLTQIAPVTTMDCPPTLPVKWTQILPIITMDCPPTLPAKETMQGTVIATTDVPPAPAPESAKPSEHSSGSATNPSTVTGRKIAKPVSRIGKAKPRTVRDEIDLLVEYFKQATVDRKKVPSKELKYDVIFQMSKLANVHETGKPEDVEWALDALTSISFDFASGNFTFPEFMADMAVALCDQLEDYVGQPSDEEHGQEGDGPGDEGVGSDGNKVEGKDKDNEKVNEKDEDGEGENAGDESEDEESEEE
ncbi:MAG: hypothetical protein M1830_010113 [Pleopsidium flavum]|nr:MAG: hypothetical protein M1830_010113 [Pleopsidium flavum]